MSDVEEVVEVQEEVVEQTAEVSIEDALNMMFPNGMDDD